MKIDWIVVLNTAVVIGIVVSALMAVKAEKLFTSIMALGAAGSFVAVEFILLQAPDVAIAEASVGVVLSTIILLITLRKTKGDEEE
jgi:energy-converting hydrogenase B subunit D